MPAPSKSVTPAPSLPETWRAALSEQEQQRFVFLRQHDYETGFLVGYDRRYRDEFRVLNAKITRLARRLNASEAGRPAQC
jgi:hypothetical protein